MTGYELLKFIHVAAVIAWAGASVGLIFLQARLRGAGDQATLMGMGRHMENMGKTYYSPLAVVTLVTGLIMVATTDGLSFEDLWIVIGIAGIVATVAIGLGMITPTGKKLGQAAQATPPDGAAIGALSRRMTSLSLINIAILFITVWAMIVKPGA